MWLTTKYSQKTGFTQQTQSKPLNKKDEHAIQVFRDGSKNEHGVGAGVAIFIQSKLEHQLRFTHHNRCSNNQAEQLAIFKALETIETLHINDIIPRRVTVHRQPNHPPISQEPTKSQLPYRRNQEECNSTWKTQLDNHIYLDEGSRRKLREWASWEASKGSCQKRRYIIEQNSPKWNSSTSERTEHS